MANSADSDQLTWIYTVYKGRVYPSSAGQGLKNLMLLESLEWNVGGAGGLQNFHTGKLKKTNRVAFRDSQQCYDRSMHTHAKENNYRPK